MEICIPWMVSGWIYGRKVLWTEMHLNQGMLYMGYGTGMEST